MLCQTQLLLPTILCIQCRREFNAMVKAAEEEEREAGVEASAAAAAAAAAAEMNWRPPQVDVSKLPHFRYSKVKVWRTLLPSIGVRGDCLPSDGDRL